MGSFIGHSIAAVFAFCIGIWIIASAFHNYFSSILSKKPYRSMLWFTRGKKRRTVAPDSIFKLSISTFAIVVENISIFLVKDTTSDNKEEIQHITIYSFFLLTALIEILIQRKKCHFPPGIEFLAQTLAFTVEGLIFYWHLHGREFLNIQVHILQILVVAGCALATAIECRYRTSVLSSLVRGFLTTVQGSWFFQIGIIIYPLSWMTKWDQTDHSLNMIVAFLFGWHLFFAFILILFIGEVTWFIHYRHLTYDDVTRKQLKLLTNHGTNGEAFHPYRIESDSECDS